MLCEDPPGAAATEPPCGQHSSKRLLQHERPRFGSSSDIQGDMERAMVMQGGLNWQHQRKPSSEIAALGAAHDTATRPGPKASFLPRDQEPSQKPCKAPHNGHLPGTFPQARQTVDATSEVPHEEQARASGEQHGDSTVAETEAEGQDRHSMPVPTQSLPSRLAGAGIEPGPPQRSESWQSARLQLGVGGGPMIRKQGFDPEGGQSEPKKESSMGPLAKLVLGPEVEAALGRAQGLHQLRRNEERPWKQNAASRALKRGVTAPSFDAQDTPALSASGQAFKAVQGRSSRHLGRGISAPSLEPGATGSSSHLQFAKSPTVAGTVAESSKASSASLASAGQVRGPRQGKARSRARTDQEASSHRPTETQALRPRRLEHRRSESLSGKSSVSVSLRNSASTRQWPYNLSFEEFKGQGPPKLQTTLSNGGTPVPLATPPAAASSSSRPAPAGGPASVSRQSSLDTSAGSDAPAQDSSRNVGGSLGRRRVLRAKRTTSMSGVELSLHSREPEPIPSSHVQDAMQATAKGSCGGAAASEAALLCSSTPPAPALPESTPQDSSEASSAGEVRPRNTGRAKSKQDAPESRNKQGHANGAPSASPDLKPGAGMGQKGKEGCAATSSRTLRKARSQWERSSQDVWLAPRHLMATAPGGGTSQKLHRSSTNAVGGGETMVALRGAANDEDTAELVNPFTWKELEESCRKLDEANIRIAGIDLTDVANDAKCSGKGQRGSRKPGDCGSEASMSSVEQATRCRALRVPGMLPGESSPRHLSPASPHSPATDSPNESPRKMINRVLGKVRQQWVSMQSSSRLMSKQGSSHL